MSAAAPLRCAKVLIGLALVVTLALAWDFLAAKLFAMIAMGDDVRPDLTTVYRYWYYFRSDHHIAFKLYGAIGAAGVLCVVVPIVLLFVFRRGSRSLFGDARWASAGEIERAGLHSETGILVGAHKGRYLMLGGSQHVLLAAPTRSGKGVSVVIPNCLNWPDSMVVLDIKQENWAITSGFRRKHGQACYLFNPAATDYRSHRWNPLSYTSDDPLLRIDDVQKIASFIYPDTAGTDPIWSASCRSLFLGIALYLLETPDLPVTIGEVLRQAMTSNPKRFAEIIQQRDAEDKPLSPACVAALSDFLDTADNTRTSIRKTFTSRLELWLNPVIDAATAANDFDLRELRRKRMSIYIGITPDNLARLAPIINLFLQQVIDLNTREMPQPGWHKVLLLMDEFTSVGKLSVLAKGVAYIAGYGLRLLPIFQTPAQVRDNELYGPEGARTLFANHALRIVFAPKDHVDAEEISKELGTTTVKSKSRSRSGAFTKGGKSTSESDQRRELLLPQEIKEIGEDTEILLLENCKPILCKKARYYLDPVFMDRLKSVSPTLGKIGKRLPSADGAELSVVVAAGELAAPVRCLEIVTAPDAQSVAVAHDIVNAALSRDAPERPVTAEDVAKLDDLDIGDFNLDFSKFNVPAGELDDAAIDKLAGDFYAAFGAD